MNSFNFPRNGIDHSENIMYKMIPPFDVVTAQKDGVNGCDDIERTRKVP